MLRIAVVLFAMGAVLTSQPARACSVIRDYVVPTNFELVQIARAVVVATPLRMVGVGENARLEFRVDEVLKGPGPSGRVQIQRLRIRESAAWSDPAELIAPRPEGLSGACTRMSFRAGQAAMLFLERGHDGAWRMLGYPFSRESEDYFGRDSLWSRTVRRYIDIQSRFTPMAQLEELERILRTELADPRSAEERTRAADIQNHLMSRSPFKPTAYLVETYEALERGETPRYALRPRSADRENSAAEALAALIFGGQAPSLATTEAQQRFVLTSLVNGEHVDAAPLFERIAASDPPPSRLGMAIRFFAKHDQYRRAYDMIERDAMMWLPRLSRDEAMTLIGDIAHAQGHGDDAPWRADAYTAGRWPRLALALNTYQVSMFGAGHARSFSEATAAIEVADFRTDPELTMALARSYNQAVLNWAIAEVLNETLRASWEGLSSRERAHQEDPARLPLRALVATGGETRDAALERVYCQSAARRIALIDALAEHGRRWLDGDLLARIAADPQLNEEGRDGVGRAAALMFARAAEQDSARGSWLWGGDSEFELLGQILRREPISAAPIACNRAGR